MSLAPQPRASLFTLVIISFLFALAGTSLFAIDENLTKGATNNHIFESGVWGENIDLLNGGLELTIPIGCLPHGNLSCL